MQRVFKNGNRCLYISQALASESDKDFNPRDDQNCVQECEYNNGGRENLTRKHLQLCIRKIRIVNQLTEVQNR